MPASTAITLAITDAAALGLGLLGGAVLTSAALTVRAGRRVSPAEAVGAVLARGSALVLPAVLLAVGSAAVTLVIQFNSADHPGGAIRDRRRPPRSRPCSASRGSP